MEENNNQSDLEREKNKKKKIFKKWWFWATIIAILIVAIVILIICLKPNIKNLNAEIKGIDNSVVVYTSVSDKAIIIEIPNYTDETKEDKKEKILDTIEKFSKKNKIPKKYTKLIIVTRIDTDDNNDYFLSINSYKLPSFKENEDESMVYIDFLEFTKSFIDSSESNETATSVKGENVTLSAGQYTVGEDIKAGKYDIIAQSGKGNVYIKGSTSVIEMMGTSDSNYYIKNYNNVNLKNGDTIEITSSLVLLFQAE